MKLLVPDLISNSYFPAVAAADLGLFAAEGLEVEVELCFPVSAAYEALRRGEADFVAGSAHSALAAFPGWRGVKLLCAQAQGMYWFLVMRADLGLKRGQIEGLRGCTIGAAPWVEMGLRRLLREGGIDLTRDCVQIIPIPGSTGGSINFGVTAAQALRDGRIDGFWANGMAAQLALLWEIGTVVLDVRRGDGPQNAFHYTFSSLATTDRVLDTAPDRAAAAIRAIVRTHAALKSDVGLASNVGQRRFPPTESSLIVDLIRRDLPYYDAAISPAAIAGMVQFARDLNLITADIPYEDAVAARFQDLWSATPAC